MCFIKDKDLNPPLATVAAWKAFEQHSNGGLISVYHRIRDEQGNRIFYLRDVSYSSPAGTGFQAFLTEEAAKYWAEVHDAPYVYKVQLKEVTVEGHVNCLSRVLPCIAAERMMIPSEV